MIIPKEEIKKYNDLKDACILLSKKFPQNTLNTLKKKTEYLINLVLEKICTPKQRYIPLNSNKPTYEDTSERALALSPAGVACLISSYRGFMVRKPRGTWFSYLYTDEIKTSLLKLVETNPRASKIQGLKQFILDLYDLPKITGISFLDFLKEERLLKANTVETFSQKATTTQAIVILPKQYAYGGICQVSLETGDTINVSNLNVDVYFTISEPNIYLPLMSSIQVQIQKYDNYTASILQSYAKFFETYRHYLAMKKLSLKTDAEKCAYADLWEQA